MAKGEEDRTTAFVIVGTFRAWVACDVMRDTAVEIGEWKWIFFISTFRSICFLSDLGDLVSGEGDWTSPGRSSVERWRRECVASVSGNGEWR